MYEFANPFAFDGKHRYTLAAIGLKVKDGTFPSRKLAETEMHRLLGKYGLHIEEVWDDKHFKTYRCNNGVTFHINRF